MRSSGFTLFQLLVVMAIIGILSSIGYYSYTKGLNPTRDATQQLVGEMNRVRADAMANTQAQRIILESPGTLRVEAANNCSKPENDSTSTPTIVNWTVLRRINWPDLSQANTVKLVSSTPIATPNILVCYTSRGLVDVSRSFTVSNGKNTYQVSTALAGGLDFYAVP